MRIIALAALTVSAYGATYYVSGTGSDSNSGLSEGAAFRTIQAAANKTLPGDVVYVMNGVYTTCTGCNLLNITRSGTAAAWIAYRAYPGHQPQINAAGAWNAIEISGGASYIEISGLHLQGNLPNVTQAQCTAEEQAPNAQPDPACDGNGISIDGRQDGANKPHHILIAGNEIYDFPGGGIGTAEADYVTVEDNFVHENAWYSQYGNSGISLWESWNYDSGQAPHTIVQRNRAFHNQSLVPYGQTGKPTDGEGIIIDTSRNNQGGDPIGAYKGGFLVQNNLCVNNGGAGLLAYQSDNITFLNNTVYGNGLVVQYADIFVNQSGSVNVWNNVVESAATGTAVNAYGSTDVQLDYNVYWNGPVKNATAGAHDLTADPQFNALGIDPASSDFHLLESSPAARTGNLAVAPLDDLEGLLRPQQPGTVNRGAYESTISGSVAFPAAGVLNAASFVGGGVSPGELVTIFGTGFGASPIAVASYGSDGYLPVEVGATRVYFDNIAAPMIYSLSQPVSVSAVAPYEISGATQVQVEYAGLRSQPVAIPVGPAAPGIYCYSGGAGQAVAVNTYADQTVAYNQDRPAARGGYLTFFITGEGQLTAPWADGFLPVAPLFPNPAAPVSVHMGGVPSECSGNWEGLIYEGVTQVNACVPAGAPTGDAVPLEVSVGGVSAQSGVTVRIGS